MKRSATLYLSELRTRCLTDAAYRESLWAMRDAHQDQQARELRAHHKLPPKLCIIWRRPDRPTLVSVPIIRQGERK